jgi:uncharacterized repeat protein (TIGR03943 family)
MASRPRFRAFTPWLDVFAIAAWGLLLLKYWLTGKLYLLIHPNYMGLTAATAATFLFLAGWRAIALLKRRSQNRTVATATEQHITLLPNGWSTALLLGVALLGLWIPPRAFASQTAIQRGAIDAPVTLTRVKPQAFRAASNTEDKSIIDWIRTLTVYPEPDAYVGQKAKVQGFVIHPPNLPDQYLLISRFIITCCAADVYPVGLPVKLPKSREGYKPDSWLEIEGEMTTETLAGKRQLTLVAKSIKPIHEPKNPYDF